MRFSVAVLKPAAWLLFGAAAIFAPIAAQAVTFTWNIGYNQSVGSRLGGSGTFEATLLSGTSTIGVPNGSIWQITSIEGLMSDSSSFPRTVNGLLSSYNTLSFNNQFEYVSYTNAPGASATLRPVAGDGIAFSYGSGLMINMFGNVTPGINIGTNVYLDTVQNNVILRATSVPAPLPILGLPAVLFYSRKIKKRLKQRSLAPVAG